LDSVLHQTQPPTEIILIDDASGDNTLSVLKTLEQQYMGRIKLIALQHNVGAASARNIGWAAATQPYLAFLDADDAWHPQKIALQYAYMQQHPDVVLCGHERRILAQQNEQPSWAVELPPIASDIRVGRLLLTNRFVTPSVMIRREVPQRFSEAQHYMEDHLLWMELACSGARVVKLDTALAAIYKQPFGEAGLSAQIWPMSKNDITNYHRLFRGGHISVLQWFLLTVYASLKSVRRLFIYWGYIRWIK
jgi:glycosyltransferase involved in cell wall biosynthesis